MTAMCPKCQFRLTPLVNHPGPLRMPCPRCATPLTLLIPESSVESHASPTSRTVFQPNQTNAVLVSAPFPDRAVAHCVVTIGSLSGVDDTPPPTPLPSETLSSFGRKFASHHSPAGSVPGDSEHFTAPSAPTSVPGYEIESTLGYGGMGTVYLARQLSLDRPVALKVMSRKWSNDPIFVARFTREAYAAALLNHSNVVQIYDIGETEGYRYFSMEYVPGRSLADHVKAEGKVDPETAVGYILQAARGLKHAHDRGMIHRDVKPDNLLLNEQGVVKVADLGLVKTPQTNAYTDQLDRPKPKSGLNTIPSQMTGTHIALGTPAYMAPEQCRDAATVDHRADIYSLGCTLYVLTTGRQPFDGTSAYELMTKHAYEPLVPPEQYASRVPRELSAIIQKMMAKSLSDRYASMGEVVRTLEQWLGVHTTNTGTFSAQDDEIEQLEIHVHNFNEAPTAVLKTRVVTGLISVSVLVAVLFMFLGKLGWAFGIAGMVLQGTFAYFVLNGIANKTYLFRRLRQFAFGLTAWDYSIAFASLGLFALLLGMSNLLGMWVGFGMIGTGLAFALRLGLDRTLEYERQVPVNACVTMLRRLRVFGLDEDDLRQFVVKYAGRDWEEFFEALFGYEAKLAARAYLLRSGASAGVRNRFAAWREPLLNLIASFETTRRETHERQLLEQVEQARLIAGGVNARQARSQAIEAATAMVEQADAIRHHALRRKLSASHSNPLLNPAGSNSVPNLGQMLAQQSGQEFSALRIKSAAHDPHRFVVNLFAGTPVRGLLAAILLAACSVWVAQNRFFVEPTESQVIGTTPLTIDGVPPEYTAWCDSGNVGWAGLLLTSSLFFRGNRMALMVLLGAVVCVFGQRLGIRSVEPIRDFHVAFLLGSVFALIGFRMAHDRS